MKHGAAPLCRNLPSNVHYSGFPPNSIVPTNVETTPMVELHVGIWEE